MTPWKIRQAVDVLAAGGIIAYPTEAVYGLGCDPLRAAAVMRLLRLKHRPMDKGLILIACDPLQLAPFIQPLTVAMREKILPTWPGPVTWLLPARPEVPAWLRGAHDTIAVRVTAHPAAAALCHEFGMPLVSTSANPAGQRPARTALQVRRAFGTDVDLILHGELGGAARPSQIRDGRSGRVLRAA